MQSLCVTEMQGIDNDKISMHGRKEYILTLAVTESPESNPCGHDDCKGARQP